MAKSNESKLAMHNSTLAVELLEERR